MPRWTPDPTTWQGADAYVVGGGESLSSFDWLVLRGKRVIGCNSIGLKHGPELVPITLFLDCPWFADLACWRRGEPLPQHCTEEPRWTGREYVAAGGRLVGRFDRYERERFEAEGHDWVCTVGVQHGHESVGKLGTGDLLYGNNAGAAALNLALSLGARRVFLLGIDLQMLERPNSHGIRRERVKPAPYKRFARSFEAIAKALPAGREVVNVSDVSRLTCFPRVSVAEHFGVGVACG